MVPLADPRKISPRTQRFANQQTIAKNHELTYKSSTAAACYAAGLEKYELRVIGTSKRAYRFVFLSPEFIEWVTADMLNIASLDSDPVDQQLETELYGFCLGHGLAYGTDTRRLNPQSDQIWELKTPDLRLFGWFPHKNHLILHKGAAKSGLDYAAYAPIIKAAVAFRNSLAVVLPDFVKGGLDDVVSNQT